MCTIQTRTVGGRREEGGTDERTRTHGQKARRCLIVADQRDRDREYLAISPFKNAHLV